MEQRSATLRADSADAVMHTVQAALYSTAATTWQLVFNPITGLISGFYLSRDHLLLDFFFVSYKSTSISVSLISFSFKHFQFFLVYLLD